MPQNKVEQKKVDNDKVVNQNNKNNEKSLQRITGAVTGIESISGFETLTSTNENVEAFKEYLRVVKGIDEKTITEIVKSKEQIKVYQEELGFKEKDVDGKIGLRTGDASRSAIKAIQKASAPTPSVSEPPSAGASGGPTIPAQAPTASASAPAALPPNIKIVDGNLYINIGGEEKTFEIDRRSITLKPNEAYDKNFDGGKGRILEVRGREKVPSLGENLKSGVTTKKLEPKTFVRSNDGVIVNIYPVDTNTGLQKIEVGEKIYKLNKGILAPVDLNKWVGYINDLPLIGGGKREIDSVKPNKVTDISKDGKTKTIKTIFDDGSEINEIFNKVEIKSFIKIEAQPTYEFTLLVYPDIPQSRTYSSGGNTLRLNNEQYQNIPLDKKEKFLLIATKEGFTNNVKWEEEGGKLVDGNKELKRYDDGTIRSLEKIEKTGIGRISTGGFEYIVKSEYDKEGKVTEYSGYVKITEGGILIKPNGASSKVYLTSADGKKTLVEYNINRDSKEFKTEYEYDKEGKPKVNKLTFKKRNGVVNEIEITDQNFEIDGNIYFFGEGIFGSNYLKIIDKDGKERSLTSKEEEALKTEIETPLDEFTEVLVQSKNAQLKVQGRLTLAQESTSSFFSSLESTFTQFQGLGYYATFFFSDDELLEWRNDVDEFFSKNNLGIEYWTSDICDKKLRAGPGSGVAYAETPQGIAQVAAHIEATKTEPIIRSTATTTQGTTQDIEFIYKITFNIRNGDYEKDLKAPEVMKFNVVLKGNDLQKEVFNKDKELQRGSTLGRIGKEAIVQYSKQSYNQVCIQFKGEIPQKWRLGDSTLCNSIIQSSGIPTSITEAIEPTSQEEEGDEEISDF